MDLCRPAIKYSDKMKFGISLYLSQDMDRLSGVFNDLGKSVNGEIEQTKYGEDVQEFCIGVICVSPEFDAFFKQKRMRYTKERREYVKDGVLFAIEKTIEMEIKLEHSELSHIDHYQAVRLLAKSIIGVLANTKLPSKIKDFNLDLFISDLQDYFRLQGWL
jgi:hypothetical protein